MIKYKLPLNIPLIVPIIASVVFILLLILLVFFIIRSKRRKKTAPPNDIFFIVNETKPGVAGRKWGLILLVMIAIILFVLLVVGGFESEKSSFCGRCHLNKPYLKAWKKSRHRSVSCQGCHRGSGAGGFLISKLEGLSNFSLQTTYYSRLRPPTTEAFESRRCLKCHADIEQKNIKSKKIKMRHTGLIKSGVNCTDCHTGVGHEYRYPGLSRQNICTTCHNGKRSSVSCNLCHSK